MDLLSRISRSIQGSMAARANIQGQWGIRFACDFTAGFHVILAGQCKVECKTTGQILDLGPGDLVFFSRGYYHELKSHADANCIDVDDFRARQSNTSSYSKLAWQEQNETNLTVNSKKVSAAISLSDQKASEDMTSFLSGRYLFPAGPVHPLFRALPDYFHIPGSSLPLHHPIKHLVELVSAEFSRPDASEVILSKLTDTLFHYILRHWLLDHDSRTHWASLYSDEAVLRAIESMEDGLDRNWTVESLARAQGLSRATLARRFKEVTEMGPMEYLNQIRMQRAASLFREENGTIEQVARRVGYDSAFAFSRSFKRNFGVAPMQFKKSHGLSAGISISDQPRTS